MSSSSPALEIRSGPFLHEGRSMRAMMWEVALSLMLVLVVATLVFGVVAPLLCGATCAGALLGERALLTAPPRGRLRDGSAVVTGLLLGLSLPPALPIWMGFLGGLVATSLGKASFGGLGHNPFNPALVGRAFLQAAFPAPLTTWTRPGAELSGLAPSSLAWPLSIARPVDAVTQATPLGLAKFAHEPSALEGLLWGDVSGSLGETSAALLVVVGLWLALRGVFDYRLAAGTLLSVATTSLALHWLMPGACPSPAFMLLSGGLLFGAVYLVTDPVTTPVTPRGAWIFGAAVGVLVVVIRVFGALPEGVMYAILVMNAATPLIDRWTQPRPFGARVH